MEGGIAQQDYDEFEMLLGEIPNATSEKSLMGQPTPPIPSQDKVFIEQEKEVSPIRKAAKLYNSPQPSTSRGRISNYGSAVAQKLQSEGTSGYEVPETVDGLDNSNMPDDKSLTLSFEEMSIKENTTTKANYCASIKNKQSPSNHAFLQNGQYENHLCESLFDYEPVETNFPLSPRTFNGVTSSSIELHVQSPAMRRNGFMNLNDRIDGQHNVKLFTADCFEPTQISESLWGNFSDEHQQVVPMTRAMPINRGMDTFQLLPSVPGLELPNPYQPKYYVDAQSPPRHITQPGMIWHSMENQSYGQLHQPCLYSHPVQNHRPEVLHVRKSINLGMGPLNGNSVHPLFELPIPHQLEHCSRNTFMNANALLSKSNPFDYCQLQPLGSPPRVENRRSSHKLSSDNGLSCSAKDFKGHQYFDKVGEEFPEKMLTRSHGMNSVKFLRPNPITSDQSLLFGKNSVRWSNVNAHRPRGQSNRSLQLDNHSLIGSSHNDFEHLHASKSLQIKFDTVDEVIGRIYLMAKDQHGCRLLQKKFTEGSQEDIEKIFSEIICHIVELMTDPFGNYLVQKLLEVCSEDQMMLILKVVTRKSDELIRISCDMHGTRAVQKVIETLRTPEQISMVVSSLEPGIVILMKNINGNHVAQRCLQYLSEYREFLIDAALRHCVELATDRQGCCVLQKCLIHSVGDQKDMLMTEISSYSLILSEDPYGNYAVQFILDQKVPWAAAIVLNRLKGSYDHLSTDKYGSNVVEKCLKVVGEDSRIEIIQELMSSPQLPQILQHEYGNYVIQSALRESKAHGDLHAALVEVIRNHASELRSSPYGKKVLSCALLPLKK